MKYSPHDLLPLKHPKEQEFKEDSGYFYFNVVQPLIPDILRMANNGIPIDLNKVEELENTVNQVLQLVEERLQKNPLIQEYLSIKEKELKEKLKQTKATKKKNEGSFEDINFDLNKKLHRTYIINTYLNSINKSQYCLEEWSIKDIKKVNQILASNFLSDFIDKKVQNNHPIVEQAKKKFIEHKIDVYNKNIENKIKEVEENPIKLEFNLASSVQRTEILTMLGIEAENFSKITGKPSYDRKYLESILKLVNMLIDKE